MDDQDTIEVDEDAIKPLEAGPKRPLLYAFQYLALPEATFQNHPDLIRELGGTRSRLPLLHFWAKAHVRCLETGLIDPRRPETDADRDRELELFERITVHPYQRDGYTAHVVTMPPPESMPEAYFTALVFKDDEPKEYMQASPSSRYFTLEKSHAQPPVLCECRRDGSRRNYGEGPPLDRDAFAAAVFERIKATQTGSNRVLLDGSCAMVMLSAPRSSKDYHLVSVEFEDGTRLSEAKVYRQCELELPPEFVGKTISRFAINALQP